ncbi:MAG: hypothetical protein K9L17_10015 [Clostridiales bacterium]|nr:hypothetical protein [Clostridiales bacterium]
MHPEEFVFKRDNSYEVRPDRNAFFVDKPTSQNFKPEAYGHGPIYIEDE